MKSLLYIDDNEDDRNHVSSVFQDSGFTVKCVNSAKGGLGELCAQEYDVVVCDMMMSGMDGLEFIKRSTKTGNAASIILTSGIPALKSFDHYSGLDNYLGFVLKPIDPETIQRMLDMKGRNNGIS